MRARPTPVPQVDFVVNSHCHEDHVAGNDLYADVPLWMHAADAPQIHSLRGMLDVYGFSPEVETAWEKSVVGQFRFQARPDVIPFEDGHVFDLGGGVRVTARHAPGHTRGHCAFWVEPDDLVFLADIDLSSFGPYYGDAWSDLVDFERTLERVRDWDHAYYATFHHVGVLEGRAAFLERFERFAGVIPDRERRLLEFLAEPHSLDDVVEHRFVYPKGVGMGFADDVERRSMGRHVERLLADGAVHEVEPGRYRAA